jgi:hypothetical protein
LSPKFIKMPPSLGAPGSPTRSLNRAENVLLLAFSSLSFVEGETHIFGAVIGHRAVFRIYRILVQVLLGFFALNMVLRKIDAAGIALKLSPGRPAVHLARLRLRLRPRLRYRWYGRYLDLGRVRDHRLRVGVLDQLVQARGIDHLQRRAGIRLA